jgi:hypothetical protein
VDVVKFSVTKTVAPSISQRAIVKPTMASWSPGPEPTVQAAAPQTVPALAARRDLAHEEEWKSAKRFVRVCIELGMSFEYLKTSFERHYPGIDLNKALAADGWIIDRKVALIG